MRKILFIITILLMGSNVWGACYSLDFMIISAQTLKVDEKTEFLPTAKTATVIESLYDVSAKTQVTSFFLGDTIGDYKKSGMIRYKEESERDKAYDVMVDSIKPDDLIKKGSYVQKHNCYHDEIPPKPCVVTERFEK